MARAWGEGRRLGARAASSPTNHSNEQGEGTRDAVALPATTARTRVLAGGQNFYQRRRIIMATNYADKTLTKAIKSHLLSVDVIPPNAEVSKLAGELAQVC